MALDERILAAAPSCYLTSLERLFATIGPQDAEQNITGQVAFGLDHADYVLLHAPRPTLICAATQDFFDIAGTYATFDETKRNYGLLGLGERMELFESHTKHGYPRPHREATLRWMRRWLLDQTGDVQEEDFALVPETELLCTKSGQVLSELKGSSVFDLNAERARQLSEQRKAKEQSSEQLLADVRRLLALPEKIEPARREERGRIEREGYHITRVIYAPEPGVSVPGLLFEPNESQSPLVIYVHHRGKAAATEQLEQFVKEDRRVLALDLRGWGETAAKPVSDAKSHFGVEYTETYLSLHLNRPLLGQRVLDLLAVITSTDEKEVELIGVGPAGLVALHAAVLEPRIKAITLEGTLASWTQVTQHPITYEQLEHVVPGVLLSYDLPELMATLAPRKLIVRGAADPKQDVLADNVRDELFGPVRGAYKQKEASDALVIKQ